MEGVAGLTKLMLVSGTMSESETTSSFPDMLDELSKSPSAFKLHIKQQHLKTGEKKKRKNSNCKILTALPVWWTLVKLCVGWFVHFHPNRPVEKPGETVSNRRARWKSLTVDLCYLSGGEMEATPVLPNDELDRLAWLSSGFSTRGGVLGTRSGLPECTPEENK